MLWELIATISAGLGAAGIALIGRLITANALPRWTIPAFAGAGMLMFQIYSEYTWFSHQKSLLPADTKVAKVIEGTAFWRPWTLLKPQAVRFIAVRIGEGAVNQVNPDLVLAEVYFFERRRTAKRVFQVFHCEQNARADFRDDLQIPTSGEALSHHWRPLVDSDPLLLLVCESASGL